MLATAKSALFAQRAASGSFDEPDHQRYRSWSDVSHFVRALHIGKMDED